MPARYQVHRLLQDLVDPGKAARFVAEPESCYSEYQLSEVEKIALRDGSPQALHALGVHPLLQMTLLFARDRGTAERGSFADLLAEFP
jgi:hypothetical protein